MPRNLRLEAMGLRSLAAALLAALLGTLLALSPQPLTDLLLGTDLSPNPENDVLLVVMEADASPGAWMRVAGQLQQRGVETIGLVGRKLPDIAQTEAWRSPETPLADGGFSQDWDGRVRCWRPAVGQGYSFPARLQRAAGLVMPAGRARIPLDSVGVPTLDQGQVVGLSSAALQGRVAILGATDAWAAPFLDTPGRPMPLAEAAARAVAGPALPVVSPLLSALLAGALAFAGTAVLLKLRGAPGRYGFIAAAATLLVFVCALAIRMGLVLPVEIPLAALAAAAFTWYASTWQNVELQLQRLQDNLLSRLGEGLGVGDATPEHTWTDLCQASISWGHSSAAWAFKRGRHGYTIRALAGEAGDLTPDALQEAIAVAVHGNLAEPMEIPDPAPTGASSSTAGCLQVFPMRAWNRTVGLLVTRLQPDAGDALQDMQLAGAAEGSSGVARNLQAFAIHGALRMLRARKRARMKIVASDLGLRAQLQELAASIDALLNQRDLLLSAIQDARTGHALYDPLGHPLLLDENFRMALERLHVPPESLLPVVWETLSMPLRLLERALGGFGPMRETLSIPGMGLDCWIYTCAYQNRILGVGIELVDISELQAQDTVKSGLLEMVSYRVHNILAAIRGYADLLSLGEVDVGEVAPRIAARCGEMAEIFTRYEDVARPPPGGAPRPKPDLAPRQGAVGGARPTRGGPRMATPRGFGEGRRARPTPPDARPRPHQQNQKKTKDE